MGDWFTSGRPSGKNKSMVMLPLPLPLTLTLCVGIPLVVVAHLRYVALEYLIASCGMRVFTIWNHFICEIWVVFPKISGNASFIMSSQLTNYYCKLWLLNHRMSFLVSVIVELYMMKMIVSKWMTEQPNDWSLFIMYLIIGTGILVACIPIAAVAATRY